MITENIDKQYILKIYISNGILITFPVDGLLPLGARTYRKISNIRRTLVGNKMFFTQM